MSGWSSLWAVVLKQATHSGTSAAHSKVAHPPWHSPSQHIPHLPGPQLQETRRYLLGLIIPLRGLEELTSIPAPPRNQSETQSDLLGWAADS